MGRCMQRALKQANDVYVAFAFSNADILFELDETGQVVWAEGATHPLLGRSIRDLIHHPLTDLIARVDHDRLSRVLDAMADGQRVRNVLVDALHKRDIAVHVMVSGYRHPDRADRYLLAMGHATGILPSMPERRVGVSGLLDRDSFEAHSRRLLQAPHPDQPYRLTVVDLPDMDKVRDSAGAEIADCLASKLGENLRSLSVDGDAAGQLTDNRYGVLHSDDIDTIEILRMVNSTAFEVVPDAPELTPKASTLVLDVEGLSATEAAKALTYTLNAIVDQDPQDFSGFSAGLQPRLSQTLRQMKAMRRTISGGKFDMVFQPIVDLWTNVVHHFECLVRFGDGALSPYQAVTFAEDTGLAGELDMAVLDRILAMMQEPEASLPGLRFAVNISGATLQNPECSRTLREKLRAAPKLLSKRLMFEITESAAIGDLAQVNGVIQDVRGLGYHVCLDDFGAGAAAFHYLRSLKVDHVKIDGSYIRDCMTNDEHVAFIQAMVGLCTQLKISTTAEYVENIETVNILKLLKVRFGQGYYFGKPHKPNRNRKNAEDAWRPPGCEWRNGLLYFKG